MNKEPLALYIFRFILSFGFFALIAMLYWSTSLLELDFELLKGDLIRIQSDLNSTKATLTTIRNSLQKPEVAFSIADLATTAIPQRQASQDDSSTNLLHVDPFYTITLPKLLGPDFKPHGIFKKATFGKPETLKPFISWGDVVDWINLCTPSLTNNEVGKFEILTPAMALKMELRYSTEGLPEYWFTLRQDVFWAPLNPQHLNTDFQLAPMFLQKHQVTAHDYKFYFDAFMNPHNDETRAVSLRQNYLDVQEIRVVDNFTLVIRWNTKKFLNEDGQEVYKMKYRAKLLSAGLLPLARFVYQYHADGTKIIEDDSDPNTYRTNPIWAQNFAHHWANNIIPSCGAWLFDGMTEKEIRFKRNPDFYEPYAALTEVKEILFRDSQDTVWADFKAGNIDCCYLYPNQLAEYEQFLKSEGYQKQAEMGIGAKRLDYLLDQFNYVGWNEANPLFKSAKVRQALTLAIDRQRIIRQNLNGMAIETTGPFSPASPSYDKTIKPYPYQLDQARQLLQEEGWYDSDGDGIIDKMIDGKKTPFHFQLSFFIKNPSTRSVCEYITTTLKEVGISCILHGVDLADLSRLFEDKSFDAYALAWGTVPPPEDPRHIWSSENAKQKGSSNAIGFSNAEVDQIIEALDYEDDLDKRLQLYHRFDAIIHEQAPYVFLYMPKISLLYREHLQNVFLPIDRPDLISNATVNQPLENLFWIKE